MEIENYFIEVDCIFLKEYASDVIVWVNIFPVTSKDS